MIVTSLGLPFEIYELTKAVTITKVVLFLLNLLLVAYLVYSRRLFGARGGKEAYEARLRAASVLDEAERAAAAKHIDATPSAQPAAAGRGGPGRAGSSAASVPAERAEPAEASATVTPGATVPVAGRPGPPAEQATIRRDTSDQA